MTPKWGIISTIIKVEKSSFCKNRVQVLSVDFKSIWKEKIRILRKCWKIYKVLSLFIIMLETQQTLCSLEVLLCIVWFLKSCYSYLAYFPIPEPAKSAVLSGGKTVEFTCHSESDMTSIFLSLQKSFILAVVIKHPYLGNFLQKLVQMTHKANDHIL